MGYLNNKRIGWLLVIRYFLKRIGYLFVVFAIMSLLLFWLFNMIPGDPARVEVQSIKEDVSAEEYELQYQLARQRLGLDDALPIRYYRWASSFLTGDFGMSRVYKRDVSEVVKTPLRVTIFYNLFVTTIVLAITIPLGIISAIKKNSTFDKVTQVATVIGFSIPNFIFALLFIYIFAVKLGWFPVSGFATPNFQGTQWQILMDKLWHLGLPILAMVTSGLGSMTRYVRGAMMEALSMDYIRTARAKGLTEKVVILSHAWRNALLTVITMLIGYAMSLFSGSLILEQMFGINGMGKFMYDSLVNMDYTVTMALNLFYIIIALVANILIDFSYGLVDPRVKITK